MGTDWQPEALTHKRQELSPVFAQNASRAQINLNEWKTGRDKQLGEYVQARDAGLKLTDALTRAAKVAEIFQWVIDADGNPVILSGSIQVIDGDGKAISSWAYPTPYSFIADAPSSKATNFREYAGDTVLAALIVAR